MEVRAQRKAWGTGLGTPRVHVIEAMSRNGQGDVMVNDSQEWRVKSRGSQGWQGGYV